MLADSVWVDIISYVIMSELTQSAKQKQSVGISDLGWQPDTCNTWPKHHYNNTCSMAAIHMKGLLAVYIV